MMRTPLGARLPLCTSHETHFKACIKEACRYSILKHLASRLEYEDAKAAATIAAALKKSNVKHKSLNKSRDDMMGIHPHVDIDATLNLSRGK